MIIHLTLKSSNQKTGPIPVSTTEESSCPPSCPFFRKGCYAKSGPLALHWSKVSSGQRGITWQSFCAQIAALPDGQLWRHNQAGDLPGQGESIDRNALFALIGANKGRRGFTYSHKYGSELNIDLIRFANRSGLTVNLSANSLEHADRLLAHKLPTVAVVPSDFRGKSTPAGNRVIVCPATQREGVTCATCGLCQRADRQYVIAFPAHGTHARAVDAIVS